MIKDTKFVFMGAGSITEAILSGLLEKNKILGQNITILNKSNYTRLQHLNQTYGLGMQSDLAKVVQRANIVMIAVKPKDVKSALLKWRDFITEKQLIISVAAGVSTEYLEDLLQGKNAVIRAMPNTSCAVGLSATAICKGKWATDEDEKIAAEIFSAIGMVVSVKEEMMDAVTGLSGSGPAYFYYMVEVLEKAGIYAGLEPETARELTLQTILGAAHMLVETGKKPNDLRKEVTSPGGTTLAGLEVLSKYRMDQAVKEAVLRAKERSRELGQFF
ncbi:pyrroline-5-carboxylate reductase [Thermoflavimicrobium daqui]|uniref:Pyrroline-5-carboxylate reductase n=1 Tax=Thermoflavimicrobium daqui TaxID=2137476 RepID=A0A364K4S5_9BACL|nr:pyrroline-5-carboxylate reductase [Thermoflavimicrobium daqui]RAL24337.1 pyrroline-5-carboxylate reductase [Thermoflavimicrobium daqui]